MYRYYSNNNQEGIYFCSLLISWNPAPLVDMYYPSFYPRKYLEYGFRFVTKYNVFLNTACVIIIVNVEAQKA